MSQRRGDALGEKRDCAGVIALERVSVQALVRRRRHGQDAQQQDRRGQQARERSLKNAPGEQYAASASDHDLALVTPDSQRVKESLKWAISIGKDQASSVSGQIVRRKSSHWPCAFEKLPLPSCAPAMPPRKLNFLLGLLIASALAALSAAVYLSTSVPEAAPQPEENDPASHSSHPGLAYSSREIGEPIRGRPWITHLIIVDLDADGLPDVVACDAQSNSIRWLRQAPRGTFTERQISEAIAAPAHVAVCDLTGSGRLDVLVASLGQVYPNNDRIGAVYVLENTGHGQFHQRTVLEHVARVSDVRGADLDGDGKTDLVVGSFGYDQGNVCWLRNLGDWRFESHTVNVQSGTIHTPIVDLNGSGRPDFLALISQEYEEVHRFENLGKGAFKDTLLWGSTNEDYGSSGLEVADLNRDGRPDLLYTNGDAFDYARPGPRPWHGIQWLENLGAGKFAFHRVGDFPGAYSPCAADLDGDGHTDLLAVSGFNDWENPRSVSMMAWLNDGHEHFTPVALARTPTHLIAAAVGDLDGDGVPEIVTGGFHAYPPFEHMSRILLWKRK